MQGFIKSEVHCSPMVSTKTTNIKMFTAAALQLCIGVCMCVYPHTVDPWHCICSIFTLDDGFLVLSIPVLKLAVELDGDDLQVTWIMVPGEVTVHTDYIHIGSLRTEEKRPNVTCRDIRFNFIRLDSSLLSLNKSFPACPRPSCGC